MPTRKRASTDDRPRGTQQGKERGGERDTGQGRKPQFDERAAAGDGRRPDREAPGNYVDDDEARDVPEPNEPA